MSNELAKTTNNGLMVGTNYPEININNLKDWNKAFDFTPERVEKINGADYVPISVIEHNLNEDFLGLWNLTEPTYQVIANQIVGTATLSVFHPIANVWLHRVGYGAVVIRQTRDAVVTDSSSIIKNALVMDFPKLRAECLKNACKSLGKKYGADLNRKNEDFLNDFPQEAETQEALVVIEQALKGCTTKDQLMEYWETLEPNYKQIDRIKKVFSNRKSIIQLSNGTNV